MSDFSRELSELSSAEDFFAYFDIAYDPQVMTVNRLHILKRFSAYLAEVAGLDAMTDETRRAAYRDGLLRAYDDFVSSSARVEKVFPVFRRGGNAFVALSSVRPVSRT